MGVVFKMVDDNDKNEYDECEYCGGTGIFKDECYECAGKGQIKKRVDNNVNH